MPYHPLDPLETQIHTSIASSLKNLRPQEDSKEGSYLDCLLLHSPLPTIEQTLQAWSILETYVPNKIRALGISNVSLPVLQTIYDSAKVKPSVVQNRFYPATKYDVPLRTFCSQHNISYQSFWTLTGNPELLKSKPVASVASLTGSYHGLLELASQGASVDASVALYALVLDLGITVLNGTTSSEHMEADLRGVRKVQEWAVVNKQEWAQARKTFQQLVEPYK
jgi:diketogulonate reductase-like aldo/keto reductase